MAKLILENDTDSLDLNGIADTGHGVQALSLSGVGLPSVSVQWAEGAGDGQTYRGQRVLPRDMDLSLDIKGADRAEYKQLVSRLARLFDHNTSGPATLRLVDDDGSDWSAKVVRVGGGELIYDGGRDAQMVLTIRAGEPYFTAKDVSTKSVGGPGAANAMVSSLMTLPVTASQAIGTIDIENTGDVNAYPVWEVTGPGHDFKAVSPTGETLHWTGTLLAGQRLIIDTLAGTVIDHTGANRYGQLATAPKFWAVPPGLNTCTAELIDTTSASRVVCTWRARKWMVV